MEDNPNSKRNIDEKFRISISSTYKNSEKKERKREEKNQIKEKGNNLMYFVLRLITKAFSRKSLVKFSPRRHKRLIALNFKGFKFYSVNRCEMNFRENETKRYFQKNFLSLSLVHTQRRFQRVNYDNYKIGQDASKYFLFHNARNINAFYLLAYSILLQRIETRVNYIYKLKNCATSKHIHL